MRPPGGLRRRLGRALPESWRRRLRPTRAGSGSAPRSAAEPGSATDETPVLSVVIPIYNVGDYLDQTLTSVRRQSWRSLEVIVVDDGSTDDGPAIVASHQARDRRIRLIRQPNAGQGVARNRGVAAARGEFLIFLDGDDLLPRGAYATMIKTLRRTGSDFVLAPALRLRPNGRRSSKLWQSIVFERPRLGTTIEEFPLAMFDVIACNRMFRRRFWEERVRPFRGGIAYEDHVPMVSALVRAERFDVITEPCYYWRIRTDGSSTRQQKQRRTNLADRLAAKAEAYELVKAEASEQVLGHYLARVLETDLYAYARYALGADAEYRRLLQAGYARYLGLIDPTYLDLVRVERKITAHLAAAGRWGAIRRLRSGLALIGDPPPAVPRRGRLELRADVVTSLGLRLPDTVCVLSRHESAAVGCIADLAWRTTDSDRARLEIEGWALIKSLDDGGTDPLLTGWLTDTGGGDPTGGADRARLPLRVETLLTPEATVWAGDRHARHDRCGFRIVLDESTAEQLVRSSGPWRLGIRIEHHGIVREVSSWSSLTGSRPHRRELPAHPVGSASLRPRVDPGRGLELLVGPPEVDATSEAAAGGRPSEPRVVDLAAASGRLTVTVHGGSLSPREQRSVRLVGPVAAVAASTTRSEGGGLESWSFRLVESRFGTQRPLPLGGYTVQFSAGEGEAGGPVRRLQVDPHAELALPVHADLSAHRVAAGITPDGTLRVQLEAALGPDERGAWAQQRLIELPASALLTVDVAVLFTGTSGPSRPALVTLADRLRAKRPELAVHWEISDPGDPVPDGVIPVLRGSRGWHALSAQARIVCGGQLAPAVAGPMGAQDANQVRLLVLADEAGESLGRRSGVRVVEEWPTVLATDPGLADRLDAAGYAGRVLAGRLPVPGLPTDGDPVSALRSRVRQALDVPADARVVLHVGSGDRGVDALQPVLQPVLDELADQARLVVWSARRQRLPDLAGVVDATGWLAPAELLLAADQVVAPGPLEQAAWRSVDPDAVEIWAALALPGALVPAADVVTALGWLTGPTARRRGRLLDQVLAGLDPTGDPGATAPDRRESSG